MDGYHTLSIIEEATEASDYDWRSSRPSLDPNFHPDPSTFVPRHGSNLSAHRISIFSSETSYGEVIPPGQSTLGLSITGIPPYYEKSLPSVPPTRPASDSGQAPTPRAAASPVLSVAKSRSSRHSIAKSDVSAPPEKEVSEIMSERSFGREFSPKSPEKYTSPQTIPSDQRSQSSQSSQSTIRAPQAPRSSRSVVSPRSSRHSQLPPPQEPSIPHSTKSRSSRSYVPSEQSSRTQSPVEFAPTPTAPSPSPRKSRSISSSSGAGSLVTFSSITRTEAKPKSQPLESVSGSATSYTTGQYSNQSSILRTFDDMLFVRR
ncbi:hypothetical protein M422DRAFT_43056 [Sphaerobolus stellatus SS14]|nr:hypothetical protein M422DRAFT_43056 [Sphaerobolus stellatus SS14]